MIWIPFLATVLIAGVLAAAWYHYSRETTWRRRLAELYLWLGPITPFSLGMLALAISQRRLSAENPFGVVISVVAPIAVLHTLLLAAAWAVGAPADTTTRDVRVAAALVIFGSVIVWFAALTWPGMGLAQIAARRSEHIFASGAFLVGALLMLAGFAMLAKLLEDAGDRFLSRLGLTSLFFGTVTWVMHLAFRLTVVLTLAQKTAGTALPDWYPPLSLWAGAMYAIYMPLAYLAIAAFGIAMLNVGWISKGWGRTFFVFGLVAAAGFFARTGVFDPPLVVNIMPYAMGMLLLRKASVRSSTSVAQNVLPDQPPPV